jgi:RNA polymerase sigma factor (sigma-70 family)
VLPTAFNAVTPEIERTAIQQHTQPGDVILNPFTSGLDVIQAAPELDRKGIAASFNPINALALRAPLWPTDARPAFTHLEDALKTARRLNENLLKIYTAHCPTCSRVVIAQHFIWDRERNQPIEKHVLCPVCGENAGPLEDDDFKELQKLDARGLPFWMLHGRVIDKNHEDADRVSDVLDAYTPRAQAALGDILLKFAALSEDDQSASFERNEELARLYACLDGLGAEKKELVLLVYHHGMTREEISTRFGRPVATVKTWLRRSLAQLKDCLGR